MRIASMLLIVAAALMVALGAISRGQTSRSLAVDAGLTGPSGATLFICVGVFTTVFLPTVGYVIAIGAPLIQVIGSFLIVAWLVMVIRWWRRLGQRRFDAM